MGQSFAAIAEKLGLLKSGAELQDPVSAILKVKEWINKTRKQNFVFGAECLSYPRGIQPQPCAKGLTNCRQDVDGFSYSTMWIISTFFSMHCLGVWQARYS